MEPHEHHLVMGSLTDFLSGHSLPDTHDERYRQKLARYLVLELGYEKSDIRVDHEIKIQAGGRPAAIKVDFLIFQNGRAVMMVKYAPGSLVTRRLSNLALSRLIQPYQVPVVVTTNGEDAEIIIGKSGKLAGEGMNAIPGPKDSLIKDLSNPNEPIPASTVDKASKIAYACEVDGSCMMDTDFKCSSWYCYPSDKS